MLFDPQYMYVHAGIRVSCLTKKSPLYREAVCSLLRGTYWRTVRRVCYSRCLLCIEVSIKCSRIMAKTRHMPRRHLENEV